MTPNWLLWREKWPPAENAFKMHGEAIAAIREVNPTYCVFCPPYMADRAAVSVPLPTIRINRPGAEFISYQDAAWTMLEAATRDDFDNQLITIAAAAPAAKAEL